MPEGVEVLQYCTASGQLATDKCTSKDTGYYKSTNKPGLCEKHGGKPITTTATGTGTGTETTEASTKTTTTSTTGSTTAPSTTGTTEPSTTQTSGETATTTALPPEEENTP